jgi:hypothetical protein
MKPNTSGNAAAKISDLLSGNKPGEKKRWRLIEEVLIRDKKVAFSSFSRNPRVATSVAKALNLKSISTVAPDGTKLVGYRARNWKRPFVVTNKQGKMLYSSEAGVRSHFHA